MKKEFEEMFIAYSTGKVIGYNSMQDAIDILNWIWEHSAMKVSQVKPTKVGMKELTKEQTDKIFNTITANGCREMGEDRFHQAVNEAIHISRQFEAAAIFPSKEEIRENVIKSFGTDGSSRFSQIPDDDQERVRMNAEYFRYGAEWAVSKVLSKYLLLNQQGEK
ncbi:MAG: hypothetical protein IPJ03_22265 [Ignavibacteriales bacterium]|nr:hypothetical protein [Ignavibacteriales bacterium]